MKKQDFIDIHNAWKEKRRVAKAKREKEAIEDDVNLLTASDEIEESYGHRAGTAFHKSIIDRLKSMKAVSSPSATNRTAKISIAFAWIIKIVSIAISYAVLDYIYKNSISQNWDLPSWMIIPLVFALATALELISSMFIKNVLNASENPLTRASTFLIGFGLTVLITYGHVVYTDLKNTVNVQKNKEKVLHIETPTTHKLTGQIKDVEKSIEVLQRSLSRQNDQYQSVLQNLEEGANAYKAKAEKYQALVDTATKKHNKKVYVLGSYKTISRVQSWANANMKRYREELAKKTTVPIPTIPKIEKLKLKKEALENALEAEYNKEKKSLDSESLEKGDINLYLQLLISFLAKFDIYGYFILRHNIKNRVLDRMHKIIDDFNVVNQLSGVLEQFSMQTGQVMKAIGLTGIKIQNELAGINRTIVTDGNRQLQSNHRLRLALQEAPIDIEAVESHYQHIGDPRVDISNSKSQPSNDFDEREKMLNEYVAELGYPHKVILDDSVETGAIRGNLIRINPNLDDESTVKSLRHELGHYEAKTHKHNDEFKKGVDKVVKKEKDKKPFEFTKVKPKDYPFSSERAVEILRAYSLAERIKYSQEEIDFFIKRQVWGEDGIDVKDYLHLMNVLDI